ncbi:zinc binding dehydrogenase [Talaromyces pinophilus]|uniref:Zinc binding dehydrogenase n=1 Tax=Talaromyces pinophilus TaxID=128442 RepID=A0A6V8H358_TALPI|nr:zinc binding dehydrogenase [Talaromyces pinophilus]
MSPILDNEAAWLDSPSAYPLRVGPGPQPDPADDEVVIKVAYGAVNPLDWKLQDQMRPIPTPNILGADVAGTVVQLGRKVTRFHVGQRVFGLCNGLIINKLPNTGWQHYSTCPEIQVCAIPDSLPLANAAVLPLSISTAAMALFVKLGLPLPSFDPKSTGKSIVIWGGSSSMGCTAIQFAVAAGYEVIATASPANFELVKSLGATHVFDYRDPDIVGKIARLLKPGESIVDCIASTATQKTASEILSKIGGGKVGCLNPPEGSFADNVELIDIFAFEPGLADTHIGDFIWRTYVPQAIAEGKLKAKPDPMIIEGGLGKVQEGIDMLRKGVSAKKIVVEIAKES